MHEHVVTRTVIVATRVAADLVKFVAWDASVRDPAIGHPDPSHPDPSSAPKKLPG
jgi:hypothetical protein